MKVFASNRLLVGVLGSLLPVLVSAKPNCQLANSNKEMFPLKTQNGDDAGHIDVSIDQRSGQIRFDSFTSNGYRMIDQQIWFDGVEKAHELPNDPSGFFMRAQSQSLGGEFKWIGMWMVNPFYCGSQSMLLSFHSNMIRDENSYDVYAGSPGSVNSIPTVPFEFECTPCDEWVKPQRAPLTKPQVLEDIDNGQGTSGGASSTPGDPGTGGGEETGIGGSQSRGSSGGNESAGSSGSLSAGGSTKMCLQEGHQDVMMQAICRDLVTVEGQEALVVGDLCVSVSPMSHKLQITATALAPYTFVRTQAWIGTGASAIDDVPTTSDGVPSTKKYPLYQCDNKGLAHARWERDLAAGCTVDGAFLDVVVVAHAKVDTKDQDNEGRVDSFLAPLEVEEAKYGYMSFSVDCDCLQGVDRSFLRRRLI